MDFIVLDASIASSPELTLKFEFANSESVNPAAVRFPPVLSTILQINDRRYQLMD
jgi:hypothetical protein